MKSGSEKSAKPTPSRKKKIVAGGPCVKQLADVAAKDQEVENPTPEEERNRGRDGPGDDHDDEDPAERLQVLQDRHPGIFDVVETPFRAALKYAVEQGHGRAQALGGSGLSLTAGSGIG